MSASLNKVTLIGCLGKDPEIRAFTNGGKVANFSIATSESWKDKATGEKKERTEWTRIAVFNPHLVDVCEKYLRKGNLVYVEGSLQTRKYEKDGREVYTTEVVLRPFNGEIKMLGGKKDAGAATHKGFDAQGDVAGPEPAATPAPIDDEIPW